MGADMDMQGQVHESGTETVWEMKGALADGQG